MKILLATSNPHKLDEIQAIFDAEAAAAGPHGASVPELVTLDDLGLNVEEPVEDGATFEANAVLKARYYAKAAKLRCLADDSGLEADALGGDPGVRSARFSGAEGPRAEVDLANNRLLLMKLSEVPVEQRSARFVCAMALVDPEIEAAAEGNDPAEAEDVLALVRGTVEGRIITPEEAANPTEPQRGRGSNGFGYDPLFFIPDLNKTSAELDPEHKNRLSHRGNAARRMWAELQKLGLTGVE